MENFWGQQIPLLLVSLSLPSSPAFLRIKSLSFPLFRASLQFPFKVIPSSLSREKDEKSRILNLTLSFLSICSFSLFSTFHSITQSSFLSFSTFLSSLSVSLTASLTSLLTSFLSLQSNGERSKEHWLHLSYFGTVIFAGIPWKCRQSLEVEKVPSKALPCWKKADIIKIIRN